MFLEQPREHEQIRITRGDRTGIAIIVAVHSTGLGPAIGGCRLRRYSNWQVGLSDALRLAAAMTDKCSLAGIDHGGGKTVAVLPSGPVNATMRYAFCRPAGAGGSGDSAQATAHGVLAALLAGAEHVFGTRSLTRRSIGVVGLGNVERYLTRLLHERGAS
jgi:leucine dehydrogenase